MIYGQSPLVSAITKVVPSSKLYSQLTWKTGRRTEYQLFKREGGECLGGDKNGAEYQPYMNAAASPAPEGGGVLEGRETPGHPGLVRPPVIGILQRTHPSSQRRLQVRIPAPPDYETIGDERLCAQRTCLEVIWILIQTTARPMPYGPILSYPAIWFSFFAWPHAYMHSMHAQLCEA